jgi:hypothetical protein
MAAGTVPGRHRLGLDQSDELLLRLQQCGPQLGVGALQSCPHGVDHDVRGGAGVPQLLACLSPPALQLLGEGRELVGCCGGAEMELHLEVVDACLPLLDVSLGELVGQDRVRLCKVVITPALLRAKLNHRVERPLCLGTLDAQLPRYSCSLKGISTEPHPGVEEGGALGRDRDWIDLHLGNFGDIDRELGQRDDVLDQCLDIARLGIAVPVQHRPEKQRVERFSRIADRYRCKQEGLIVKQIGSDAARGDPDQGAEHGVAEETDGELDPGFLFLNSDKAVGIKQQSGFAPGQPTRSLRPGEKGKRLLTHGPRPVNIQGP